MIHDGKLTAWLDQEIRAVLDPILPPVGKLYEGVNTFEVKSIDPRYTAAREKLIAVTREYARKERSDEYENPVEVTGEVDHGFCD
jgi:hypothetical protein